MNNEISQSLMASLKGRWGVVAFIFMTALPLSLVPVSNSRLSYTTKLGRLNLSQSTATAVIQLTVGVHTGLLLLVVCILTGSACTVRSGALWGTDSQVWRH